MKRAAACVLAAGLCACVGAPTAPGTGATFDVRLHQRIGVSGTPVLVQFDSVAADSRCPIGAMCVWAGKASVAITIWVSDAAIPRGLTSTPDSASAFALGWFVDYVDLRPYPSVVEPPSGPPVLRLRVRQAQD